MKIDHRGGIITYLHHKSLNYSMKHSSFVVKRFAGCLSNALLSYNGSKHKSIKVYHNLVQPIDSDFTYAPTTGRSNFIQLYYTNPTKGFFHINTTKNNIKNIKKDLLTSSKRYDKLMRNSISSHQNNIGHQKIANISVFHSNRTYKSSFY